MKHRIHSIAASICLLSFSQIAFSQETSNYFIRATEESPAPISTSELALGVMSRSYIEVDPQILRDGSMITADYAQESGEFSEGIRMELPDGTTITLMTNRLQSHVRGVETYSGWIKDSETGFFTLSIENQRVFGQINLEYMAYDIQFDKFSQSHVLSEIDLAKMPKFSPDPKNQETGFEPVALSLSMPAVMSSSVNGTVRVLVLHGSDVSNINSLASNIISKMNDSLFDDGMDPDFHVTLADIRNLNDDLDGLCSDEILEAMEDTTAPFTNLSSWRDDENADVVLTVATTDSSLTCTYTGAYGRIGGQASGLLDSTYPFAVAADTYAIGDLTAVHEIGHVLGGGHPTWSVANLEAFSQDVEPYSRGYIPSSGDWQTIMGSYDENGCDFSTTLPNTDCVRILRWSDPDKIYSGESRGVEYTSDTQVPYSADMKSALQIQMPIAAAFESYPGSAPSTPSGFLVINEKCYGSNEARWNSVSTANNYQLLQSTYSNFSYPTVRYFGPSTSVDVNVAINETLYLKVRACNGNGCSDLSAQRSATYFSGCL